MSALEQAFRQIIREELQSFSTNTPGNAAAQQATGQTQQTAPAHDPFGGLGGGTQQQAAPVQRTPQELQQLIMPHISNEATKAQLSAEMQRLGVSDLGSARQEQLGPLYDAFSAVIARAGGGQPVQAQTGGII